MIPIRSTWPGCCAACGVNLPVGEGLLWGPPARGAEPYALLCRSCGLETAPLGEVDARLAACAELYHYQREGARWLAGRWAALLSDDMGLGKTVQALMAVPDGVGVVVGCKASIKSVWVDEAQRWRPDLTASCLEGRGSWVWPEAGELLAVNPEILPDDPGEAPPGVVVICDEAHWTKSPGANRTQRWRRINAEARSAGGRVWLLTGTPSKGKPSELWEVLRTGGLAYAAFGRRKVFDRLFYRAIELDLPPTDAEQLEIGVALQRVELRRLKIDVLPDLPQRRHVIRRVPLDADALRAVEEAIALMFAQGQADRDVMAGRLLPWRDPKLDELRRVKRRSAWNLAVERHLDRTYDADAVLELVDEAIEARFGAAFEQLSRVRRVLAEVKLPGLVALVEEAEAAGQPLIVFSQHRRPVELMAQRPGWGAVLGGGGARNEESVRRFIAGELHGLALTGAGQEGLTLVRCGDKPVDHAVFVDLAWRPTSNRQAEDRLIRIGQEAQSVLFTQLVADHAVDERVTELLSVYEGVLDAVDAGRAAAASLSS